MDQTANLLDKLTQAVSFKYPGKVAPGVLISHLPNKQYYVSILQYGSNHMDKKVMHSAKHESLEHALKTVTQEFLRKNRPQTNPVEELVKVANVDLGAL